MLGVLAAFWLANAWAAGPQTGGDVMRDINGVLITVGAHVAFVGTVRALNPSATHFDDVTITSDHPVQNNAVPDRTVSFHPLELIVQ